MSYDRGPTITIRRKTLIGIGIAVLAVVAVAMIAAKAPRIFPTKADRATAAASPAAGSAAAPASPASPATPAYASVNGVDAEVTGVERGGGKTVVYLTLNNHQYDLSTLDASRQSTLKGVRASAYEVLSNGSGGHHLQSRLTFNGDLSGPLVLILADGLAFNFTVL